MKVTDVKIVDNKVKGLTTDYGAEYEFDVVVDCTGPWSKITGEMVGLNVPIWHTKAEAFFLCPPGKQIRLHIPSTEIPRVLCTERRETTFLSANLTIYGSEQSDACRCSGIRQITSNRWNRRLLHRLPSGSVGC